MQCDIEMYLTLESGVYNSVWEQKLGVCYSVLQCKAGHAVGVHIHTTSNMSTLVGKVLYNCVHVYNVCVIVCDTWCCVCVCV